MHKIVGEHAPYFIPHSAKVIHSFCVGISGRLPSRGNLLGPGGRGAGGHFDSSLLTMYTPPQTAGPSRRRTEWVKSSIVRRDDGEEMCGNGTASLHEADYFIMLVKHSTIATPLGMSFGQRKVLGDKRPCAPTKHPQTLSKPIVPLMYVTNLALRAWASTDSRDCVRSCSVTSRSWSAAPSPFKSIGAHRNGGRLAL